MLDDLEFFSKFEDEAARLDRPFEEDEVLGGGGAMLILWRVPMV